jgi:LPXTG-site transpeptidase (sortase) family protein
LLEGGIVCINLYIKLLPLYIGLAILVASPFSLSPLQKSQVEAAAYRAQATLNQPKSANGPAEISGQPVRIILPGESIDLPVVKGYYIRATQTWYVSPNSANYAPNTALINNQKGASLIYGHALNYIFGNTRNIKAGDKAIVYTQNGHIFEYEFSSQVTVDPSDTQVFSEVDNKPVLKLLTCGGSWSQNRRIMTFNLVRST